MGSMKRMSREEQNIVAPAVLEASRGRPHLHRRRDMDTLSPHTQDHKPYFVYELVDPRDMSIFYVGITIDLYMRFKQHMRCDGINPQKDARIRDITDAGHLVIMRTIERVVPDEARKREDWWIWTYRCRGVKLLNLAVPLMKYDGLKHRSQPPATHSKPYTPRGRERTFSDVIGMLVVVRETKEWPSDVSDQMRRHYRRHYPEFFKTNKKSARARDAQIEKASRIRAERQ